MRLTPSDIYTHYRPRQCDLRLYLKDHEFVAAEPSPYALVLKRLGKRHEANYLSSLGVFTDLSDVPQGELLGRTKAAINSNDPVIYQALLESTVRIAGIDCEITGRPDYLIKQDLGYIICDSKMSRRINDKDHPEIILQMQTYGWLFEQMFGIPAQRLEVHRGDGEIECVEYVGPDRVLDAFRQIISIKALQTEPFSPVGFSKCSGCGFHDRCWNHAREIASVALVVDVDQGLALALHDAGIHSVQELIDKFDEDTLSELKRTQGSRLVRVGARAAKILRNAKVYISGKEIVLSKPAIPAADNYLMFDLEGMPPQFDELQKVYLWGMQVFGEDPSEYICSTAGFGPEGDRQGWEEFLVKADEIFQKYGDVRFVHWAPYEKTLINHYKKNYGDHTGGADRVLKNLLDLNRVTEDSVVLPLPSYSLKVIEKYVNFKRTLPEANGDWSMATYIEATETEDEATRQRLMDDIRLYNQEDLQATWEVLKWLQTIEVTAH